MASANPTAQPSSLFVIADLFGTGPFDLALGPFGDGHLFAGAGLDMARGGFVADPFLFSAGGRPDHLVFEYYDAALGRGTIAAADRDGDSWVDARVILTEPAHLSYPHPVRAQGYEGLMLTETAESGAVSAYRWDGHGVARLEARLLDRGLVDPTPLLVDGTWYLFGATDNQRHDTLELWVSSGDLFGPWRPHPRTPVSVGPDRSRPAGPVFVWDHQRYRAAQVCDRHYGEAVVAIPILTITPEDYREGEPVPLLPARGTPGSMWWNRLGMHHVDFTSDHTSGLGTGGVWAVADGQRPLPL